MEPISQKSQHHKLQHNAKVLPHYYIQFSLCFYLHFLVFSSIFCSSRLLFSLAKNLKQTDQRIIQYVLSSTYIRQLHKHPLHVTSYIPSTKWYLCKAPVFFEGKHRPSTENKGINWSDEMVRTDWTAGLQKHRISDLLQNKVTYRVSHEHPRVVTAPFIHVLMALHAMNKPFPWQSYPHIKIQRYFSATLYFVVQTTQYPQFTKIVRRVSP
jgi:hypothetical protein